VKNRRSGAGYSSEALQGDGRKNGQKWPIKKNFRTNGGFGGEGQRLMGKRTEQKEKPVKKRGALMEETFRRPN